MTLAEAGRKIVRTIAWSKQLKADIKLSNITLSGFNSSLKVYRSGQISDVPWRPNEEVVETHFADYVH